MDEGIFDLILDEGESVQKILRPNKTRYYKINVIFAIICMVLIGVGLIVGGIVGFIMMGNDDLQILLPMMLTGLFVVIVTIIYMVYIAIVYNKTFYGITNRRIIIRTGFIGADYRALDFDMIGCMSVKVGLLDKIIKPVATGTITFGSAAAPLTINAHNVKVSHFSFTSIDDPYNSYKEIKQYINKVKKEK